MNGLSTVQLADHLKVSYRQLDYLARQGRWGVPEVVDLGSGGRRRWPLWTVGRLEVAGVLHAVVRNCVVRGTAHGWTPIAERVLSAADGPPPKGWVVLGMDGDLTYGDVAAGPVIVWDQFKEEHGFPGGGIVAFFELSDVAQGLVPA